MPPRLSAALRRLSIAAALLLVMPIGVSAVVTQATGPGDGWWTADRSSVGMLPVPDASQPAMVRVLAARTVRWRGIFAVHSWIVVKDAGADRYRRYDYTAWGTPIRRDGFEPDGRWFGREPILVFAADGPEAAAMIPRIEAAIDRYTLNRVGDYRAWPGPNSNTFVAAAMASVPRAGVVLPPHAIGKDFPYDGRWFGWSPSGTGLRLTLGGYLGLTLGWVEGIEISVLGAVIGLDMRRPALKLPGIGRIGLSS